MVWLSIVFSSLLPYRNSKRLRDFEEIEISSKAAEVTVNNKEENSEDFCLDFVQEFGPRTTYKYHACQQYWDTTLIKRKTKFSSYIRKFRWDRVQSHIWGRASQYMRKCEKFSPCMRRALVIYDFALDPPEFPYIWGKFYFIFYQCIRDIFDPLPNW